MGSCDLLSHSITVNYREPGVMKRKYPAARCHRQAERVCIKTQALLILRHSGQGFDISHSVILYGN